MCYDLSDERELAAAIIDILDFLGFIKICVGYENRMHFPIFHEDLEGITPQFEVFSGWMESTKEIKRVEEFTKNVKVFVSRIEALLDCPVEIFLPTKSKKHFNLQANEMRRGISPPFTVKP